ncbi:MAG: ABC transporter permease [Eubacteriales bacterium]|nr:ABC transporter permease [Eubacteriales bacterium]
MKKKHLDISGFLSSILAIIIGLAVGFIILLICNKNQAIPGFQTIITGAITHGQKGIGQVFYYATPLILCGLAVGFAFKTGLFNIGASGQFTMGAFGATLIGICIKNLGQVHWIVALLVAIIFGAIWGSIPGILKAFFNVNEVISAIMLNYVGMYLVNWIVGSWKIGGKQVLFNSLRNESYNVSQSAIIPKWGLDKLFPGSSANSGIIIAIIVVILIYLLLEKTTFGFELKAVGYNKHAGKYAGINEKKNIILAMLISGAIAGLAGGLVFLSGTGRHIEIVDVVADEGFTGISVALLGLSNPFGVLLAGLFIAYLQSGGFYLQLFSFSTEIIDIIVAVIIYFSAFALIVRLFIMRIHQKNENKEKKLNKSDKKRGVE